jgi:hypothetical protein
VEFLLIFLFSKARRDDVYNDIQDWYPRWVSEHGPLSACVLCVAAA